MRGLSLAFYRLNFFAIMDKETILASIKAQVKAHCLEDMSGHDWHHIDRVVSNALLIGEAEGADLYIVQLAALLHDLKDWKFNGGYSDTGHARALMQENGVDSDTIEKVCDIVANVSFKGTEAIVPMKNVEGQAVQDADRLDALGAVGISRCFAYGGSRGIPIYDPEIVPSFDNYSSKILGKEKTSVINHFHEKLLILKDLMNTPTGKKLAQERHAFIESFLDQFYKEVGKS